MMISIFMFKQMLEHLIGLDVTLDSNTTLNEKYNVLPSLTIPVDTLPKLKYLGIGIGGVGDVLKHAEHKAIHGTLYNMIPFACRRTNNDLSNSEASAYRLRVVETINGLDYAFYYLKHITTIADVVNIKVITKNDDGSNDVELFNTATPEILNPVPGSVIGLTIDKSVFYTIECKISLALTQEEKDEVVNAYQIKTGLLDKPNISEMCLYTGMDTVLPGGMIEAYGLRSGVYYPVPYELQPLLSKEGTTQRYIDIGTMRLN